MPQLTAYETAFEAAIPKFYPGEAEFDILRCGGALTLSLPADDGEASSAAMKSARSLLADLDAHDEAAKKYLRASPNWPYGDDVLLWLLLVGTDDVRFCYRQESVNDEQVIGFRREGESWLLVGPDPRFRG